MDRDKFDYYWKVALLVVLIFSISYMFWEFKQINKQGLECHSAPFDYGVREAKEIGIACTYSCINEWARDFNERNKMPQEWNLFP